MSPASPQTDTLAAPGVAFQAGGAITGALAGPVIGLIMDWPSPAALMAWLSLGGAATAGAMLAVARRGELPAGGEKAPEQIEAS